MKKPILLLLCLVAILLGTWFLLSLPRQEVVDTTLTGYRFSPEGGEPALQPGNPRYLQKSSVFTGKRHLLPGV